MFIFRRFSLAFSILALSASISFAQVAETSQADINEDRFESFNRAMFSFNMTLDEYFFRPVALGYRRITNQFIRDRVSYALRNIKEPAHAVNNLLQAQPVDSLTNVGRFAINTTLGLFGTFDVAGGGFGLEAKTTGFDETLSSWCVADGPYIVMPLLGGSTPRSIIGDFVDGYTNPLYVATYNDANIRDKVLYSYVAVNAISKREAAIELIDDLRKNSVDFYAAVRSAFIQNRMKMKRCGSAETNAVPNYDFDFDMDNEY